MDAGDRVATKSGVVGTVRRTVPELIGRPALAWIELDGGGAAWIPVVSLTLEPARGISGR